VDACSSALAGGSHFSEPQANPVQISTKLLDSFGNRYGISDGPLAFQPAELVSTRLQRGGPPLGIDGVEVVSVGLVAESLSLNLLALQIGTGAFAIRERLDARGAQTRLDLPRPTVAAAHSEFVLDRLRTDATLKADPHQTNRYGCAREAAKQSNNQRPTQA